MRPLHPAVIGGTVAALLLAAWAGTGIYTGHRIATELQALRATAPRPGSALRLTGLEHQRGLFSSSGQAEVALDPGCSGDDEADTPPITLRLRYQMAHLPLPSGLARVDWQAEPTGDTAATFRQAFGSLTPLAGHGSLGLGGALRSDMNLPALTLRSGGETLQASPSSGFVRLQDKQLAFGWTTDRIVLRSREGATELQQLAIDLDLNNRWLGTGTSRLAVGKAEGSFGRLEGLEIASTATDRDGRLDVRLTPTLRQLEAEGRRFDQLGLELAVTGLDTVSTETLSTLLAEGCGVQALTRGERQQVHGALTTLLQRGFTLALTRLAGRTAEGEVSGQFELALQPARGDGVSLAVQLGSRGELALSNGLLDDGERELALSTGYVVADGPKLRAAFDYAAGRLTVNGRPRDAEAITRGLETADEGLRALLAELAEPARGSPGAVARPNPPDAQPEEVIEPVPAAAPVPDITTEAPAASPPSNSHGNGELTTAAESRPAPAPVNAPAPAAGARCADLGTCVRASLQAARQQDIDTVRTLAAQLDGLPKPALGNRAIGRRLNTEGLALLRQGDAGAAVERLGAARQENPRDVEVAANLGYALVKANRAGEAAEVLQSALLLDPRRTSTWTPLAEALALAGRADDAQAALWVAWQWSANRDKSIAFYNDRAANETQPPLRALYARMSATVGAVKP